MTTSCAIASITKLGIALAEYWWCDEDQTPPAGFVFAVAMILCRHSSRYFAHLLHVSHYFSSQLICVIAQRLASFMMIRIRRQTASLAERSVCHPLFAELIVAVLRQIRAFSLRALLQQVCRSVVETDDPDLQFYHFGSGHSERGQS